MLGSSYAKNFRQDLLDYNCVNDGMEGGRKRMGGRCGGGEEEGGRRERERERERKRPSRSD